MYKNQLQEVAQRSCFNLPSYTCIREGPDHAPRFKASVNFNGEIFESPFYSTTLRQAEHTAAQVALNSLSGRGPSKSLMARVLDETGVYKNLLQETAHRAGLKLPLYTTAISGPGHVPVFTSTVELAGLSFTGEPAKTKKQAEKNAAIAAWATLRKVPTFGSSHSSKEIEQRENQSVAIRRRVYNDNHHSRGNLQKMNIKENNHINPTRVQRRKLPDRNPGSSAESSRPKQNVIFSLLPPPPPRTMSKILSPDLPKSNELPQRDDDQEWITYLSDTIVKTKLVEINGSGTSRWLFYGGKALFSGPEGTAFTGVNRQCQRVAPAVQIRSVVPVCAAPPQQSNQAAANESELTSNLRKLKL